MFVFFFNVNMTRISI